jgi:hypothetical protein
MPPPPPAPPAAKDPGTPSQANDAAIALALQRGSFQPVADLIEVYFRMARERPKHARYGDPHAIRKLRDALVLATRVRLLGGLDGEFEAARRLILEWGMHSREFAPPTPAASPRLGGPWRVLPLGAGGGARVARVCAAMGVRLLPTPVQYAFFGGDRVMLAALRAELDVRVDDVLYNGTPLVLALATQSYGASLEFALRSIRGNCDIEAGVRLVNNHRLSARPSDGRTALEAVVDASTKTSEAADMAMLLVRSGRVHVSDLCATILGLHAPPAKSLRPPPIPSRGG